MSQFNLSIENLGAARLLANPDNVELRQVITRVKANVASLERGSLYGDRYGGGKTLTQIVGETWLDNPKMSDAALIANASHTIKDTSSLISKESQDITQRRFPDYASNPLQRFAASLKAIFISSSPEDVEQIATEILEGNSSYGLLGPGERTPRINQRYTIDDPVGIGTSIHDNNTANDEINRQKVAEGQLPANFVEQNSENTAVWGYASDEGSALAMFFGVLRDAPSRPETDTGIVGAAVGGQIASYFVDDNFASQLLVKPIGATVTGWIGDSVDQLFTDDKSIGFISLPNRFISNTISNVASLVSGEISEEVIELLDLDSPLEQIATSTIVSTTTSRGLALTADSLLGSEIAIKYFGASPVATQVQVVDSLGEIKGQAVADFSLSSFGTSLANAGGAAIGSFAGAQASDKLLNTDSREAQFGGSLGSTVGSILGQMFIPIPIPGAGAAIGAAVGNLYGSFIGYLLDEAPVLAYILAPGASIVIEVVDFLVDEDFPRAAYVVKAEDGTFLAEFAYELDEGSIELAEALGKAAENQLNYWTSTIGGTVLSSDNIYYGHRADEDGNQMVYQLEDDAPGGSSWRRRVGFGDDSEAAVEAGVTVQLTTTKIEGGDLYIKRALANLEETRGSLEELNKVFQAAKEYGISKDNSVLYAEYVEDLEENAIPNADKKIVELRSRPWERFVPPSLDESIITEVSEELSPETIELSLENDDLIIDGKREVNWIKTQFGNKPQFIRFNDDSLYNIVVYIEPIVAIPGGLLGGDSDPVIIGEETKVKLELYTPDPTIRDFGLEFLPTQVSLALNGNDLIVEGEVISDWLTKTGARLKYLRFADGSRFQIVAENGNVQLQHEFVSNWKEIKARAAALNLDTPQASDLYKGDDLTQIIHANGGIVQGEDDSNDVLISSAAAETLKGGRGDDIYRYSSGNGSDIIEDTGGVDVIELGGNIQLNDLTLTQNNNDLTITIAAANSASNAAEDKITIKDIASNSIEFIRLSNNEEYLINNASGQWQLIPASTVQTSSNDSAILQGTLGRDTLRGTGENDTLQGGSGNDIYLYSIGDGNRTTIYDTGDYEGIVRDGGTDTLVLGTTTLPLLALEEKDLIVTVAYVPPSLDADSGAAEPQPIEIRVKDWTEENSRIEFIRLANGQDYVPVIQQDGSVTLQSTQIDGQSTVDVQLDVPDSYELSSRNLAVVDFQGNGLQLISAQDAFAMSDQDDDGSLEQTGWVAPTDGFLVIDQNNDGQITDLNEFISLTAQPEVTHLNSLNSNGDNFLNVQDDSFNQLRIWTDNNGNNRVELGELAALHRYGIADISLHSQAKNFELAGNLVSSSTYFTQLGYRYRNRSQIFDVAFAYNPDGVKLEELGNGLNQFTFENKPNIIVADSTASDLNLEIDPTLTYSVTGGGGNDTLRVLPGSTAGAILNGGDGDDTLVGGDGFDILNGAEGRDVIKGGGGDDTITVDQDDFLFALDGGDGFDIVTIDERDRFHLKLSDRNNIESIIGNRGGDDITYEGSNSVLISGGTGNDTLTGGDGDDQIEGGENDDDLFGGDGNDLILGSIGDDQLHGEDDDDQLYGQAGDDLLEGGNGNDFLDGSIGNDLLIGGKGDNTYVFGRDYGVDTIDIDYRHTGIETVSFKSGITPEDITFWRKSDSVYEQDNLYIAIKDTHDRLIIKDQFAGLNSGVDQFIFADGSTLEIAEIKAQLLESTNGDDSLFGYYKEDSVLDGGAGNDTLDGDSGENIYAFGRGYGIDTIITSYNSDLETVRFNSGITPADVILSRLSGSSPSDKLQISIKNTLDRLIVEDQFRGNAYNIDQFSFADGTTWTARDVELQLLQSTDGDDTLIGYFGSDDILQGDAGNDTLDGNSGQNTYIFGRGDGVDTIDSNYNSGVDTLKFKAGISSTDITFWREPSSTSSVHNRLYFGIKNTSDQVIVEDHFFGSEYGIDEVVFDNGTTWTREYIEAQLLQSTNGDDMLTGYAGDDLLDGAGGNDILNGKTGQNTYRFGRGDGVDRITSNYNTKVDTLQLESGISPTDLSFARKPSNVAERNDLYIGINNTADRIIIEDQFYGNGYGIDQIKFADGTVISSDDISAMSLPESIPGDDIFVGADEENTLGDANGNDLFQGGIGNDTYVFNRGHGQDTIEEDNLGFNSYYDIVKFGAGLNPETMKIVREDKNLVFIIPDSSDRLTIKDQFDYAYEAISIEEFQFDGGKAIWTKEDIKQYLLTSNSTNGNDLVVGYSEGINSETLDGGPGNDFLEGGAGDDSYTFKKGYGQDTIREDYSGLNSFYDTVNFGEGLTPDTMNIFRQEHHLIFDVEDTRDRLIIENQFDYPYESVAVEEFSFNNGASVWTKEDIKRYLIEINSTDGDDIIVGYSEDDSSGLGDNSSETLDGGLGNDVLRGGTGDDTYIFDYGYGQDLIEEDEYIWDSNYDTVKFGAGLTLNTMSLFREGNDLVFKVNGSDDRLTIRTQFNNPNEALSIEEFQFDNGSIVWTKEDIKRYLIELNSTDGDDIIVGYSEDDSSGLGDNSSETLDGGLGNDVLRGGTGDDTYIFDYGYGQDLIEEDEYIWDSNYDTVKFGAGLSPDTMEIVRKDNTLIFKVNGRSDRLTIEKQFDYPSEAYSVEEFQFDDGEIVWTKEDIKRYLLDINSTDGDDHIVGYSWTGHDDTLDGGIGHDLLEGGFGDDTYIFKAGYGKDIIQEDAYGSNSYHDTVKFGVGLTPDTLEILRQGEDLIFRLKGEEDQLTIERQFGTGEYYAVEEFQFDDGAIIWTKEDIKLAATEILPSPVLVTTAFDVVNDHLPTGEATITFTLENQGAVDATAFDVGIIHSNDDIIGNADDVLVDTFTVNRLTSGQKSTQTKTVQLSRDLLNSRAQVDDLTGLGSDHVSASYDYLGIVIDPSNQLDDDIAPDDALQGEGINKDDITYFPWDIDGNGLITPTDTIFVINRLGRSTPAADIKADFDGNGVITPTDAISSINRLGYSINPNVFE